MDGDARMDIIPSKANTTTVTVLVTEDARRGHLVWREKLGELVLVHRLRQVRDVQVGVVIIRERLELAVERFLHKVSVMRVVLTTMAALTRAKVTSYPR